MPLSRITPSFYNLIGSTSINGVASGDLHKMLYNLYLALYALSNNIDQDAGTINSDYASKVGTPLYTSGGVGQSMPLGAADATVGNYYTPTSNMKAGGMRQADIFTALYDLGIAIKTLCTKVDADHSGSLDTNFRALISTPLIATLGSMLGAPADGLITSTYYYGLESYIDHGCYNQGDIYKCLYDLYIAIVRMCTILDTGAGTLPQTLLAGVGTPLNTAIGAFIRTPSTGARTTGS